MREAHFRCKYSHPRGRSHAEVPIERRIPRGSSPAPYSAHGTQNTARGRRRCRRGYVRTSWRRRRRWFAPPRGTPVRWSGLWKPSHRRRAPFLPVYLCVYLYIRLCLPLCPPVSSCTSIFVYTFVWTCLYIVCVYTVLFASVAASTSLRLHVCLIGMSTCTGIIYIRV